MDYVLLGKSGLRVSEIALGTGQFWDTQETDAAVATIRSAREQGVNFFDTARTYGNGQSERVLGAALQEDLLHRRGEVVLASKGGLHLTPEGPRRDASPAKLRRDLEESLSVLGVEQIDLYHVHWPDPNTPTSETAGVLADLVTEGKIGHVGLSNFDVEEVEQFNEVLPPEALQPSYHLLGRGIEEHVLPYAKAHDLGILVYGALGHGLLTGTLSQGMHFPKTDWRSYSSMYQGDAFRINMEVVTELQLFARDELGYSIGQLAIAWVLANSAVDVAIVGTGRADHMEEAIAATKLALDGSALRRVDEIVMRAVTSPGPTPETTPLVPT